MYDPETILALKEPRWRPLDEQGEPGEWTPDGYDKFLADTAKLKSTDNPIGEEFPYNRVKVIGPSPIQYGGNDSPWQGAASAGVIIQPLTGFSSTEDRPLGLIQSIYNVESIPEPVVVATAYGMPTQVVVAAKGPTPEEVFAVKAPGVPPEEGQTRGRTPISPLDEIAKRPPSDNPLNA